MLKTRLQFQQGFERCIECFADAATMHAVLDVDRQLDRPVVGGAALKRACIGIPDAIYKPYVENTTITFEYDVPTLEDFTSRIVHTLARYPYLVACLDGEPVGYAYAGAFKSRAAYDRAVELSGQEFLHPDHIYPFAEFIAALMEMCNGCIAELFMELHAASPG